MKDLKRDLPTLAEFGSGGRGGNGRESNSSCGSVDLMGAVLEDRLGPAS